MKEQGQDISGDTEDGPDSLGVATILQATTQQGTLMASVEKYLTRYE